MKGAAGKRARNDEEAAAAAAATKKRRAEEDDDELVPTLAGKPEKRTNDDNDPYWELSAKRRVTVQEFKGHTLVALREYYEKDGKTLPGKQGISLTVEQFSALLLALPDIKSTLREKGFIVESDEDLEDEVSKDGQPGSKDEDEDSDEDD